MTLASKRYIFLIVLLLGGIHSVSAHEDPPVTSKPYTPLSLEEIERFHGHLGPSVILGVRMGEDAVLNHQIPRCFGIKVEAVCEATPPGSCLLDGLQLSTGATLGKANIHRKDGGSPEVTISDVKRKVEVKYHLKEPTRQLLGQWKTEGLSVDEQARKIFEMKAADLFEIKETSE